MVEGARLESVYTPKGYRGFESRPLRFLKAAFLPTKVFILVLLFSVAAIAAVDEERELRQEYT